MISDLCTEHPMNLSSAQCNLWFLTSALYPLIVNLCTVYHDFWPLHCASNESASARCNLWFLTSALYPMIVNLCTVSYDFWPLHCASNESILYLYGFWPLHCIQWLLTSALYLMIFDLCTVHPMNLASAQCILRFLTCTVSNNFWILHCVSEYFWPLNCI